MFHLFFCKKPTDGNLVQFKTDEYLFPCNKTSEIKTLLSVTTSWNKQGRLNLFHLFSFIPFLIIFIYFHKAENGLWNKLFVTYIWRW